MGSSRGASGTTTSCTDGRLFLQPGGSSANGDSFVPFSAACFGVGLLGRGLVGTDFDACAGVGFVGRTGVGVPSPVACPGVGLVGRTSLGDSLDVCAVGDRRSVVAAPVRSTGMSGPFSAFSSVARKNKPPE